MSNLILIGMPGAGKSTVGVILAKRTARGFLDTDVTIQTREQRSLQEIVDTEGYMHLRDIEEKVLLDIQAQNHVIATGGSAIYSQPAMAHLKATGPLIFLQVELPELEQRVLDIRTRGIAKRPDQDFVELFHERAALYAQVADITINCSGLNQEQVCEQILASLSAYYHHSGCKQSLQAAPSVHEKR